MAPRPNRYAQLIESLKDGGVIEMFCDGLLLDVRTSAVTKKYWRRSAACCLVETTVHRIACRKLFVAAIESPPLARATRFVLPRAPGFAPWCCNFFKPPPEARRAGDRLGVLPGGAPSPLGAFSGKWARGRGASIGLRVDKGLAWGWHGVSMGFAWGSHGVRMGFAWGLPIEAYYISLPID